MMESTQKRAEQATTPLKSAAGDLRRAKSAGSASVQELRHFLQSHRGKSSQELLGDLGTSSLVGAMLKATLGCVALLAVLTIGPYFLYGKAADQKSKATAKKQAAAASSAAIAPAAPSTTTEASRASAGNVAPDGVDLDKAKQAMGLDETKTAPDNVNPREKDLDNLLDGVK